MASSVPEELIYKLTSQMLADPLLPHPSPTEAFWQIPPHPQISEIQSPSLPQRTDYAIIGSGITGCSIAKNLLDHPCFPPNATITVLEARKLCSGATGRNGGALTSFAGYEFLTLSKHHGQEEASKIGRFANRTLDKMHELGNSTEELKEASEVRRLRGIIAYRDEEAFKHAQESFKLYEECVPEAKANVEVLTPEEALSRYNVKDTVGALVHSCGAFWPYRLITALWSDLLSSHPSNLTIETSTPVTAISHSPHPSHPYLLSTPRGPLSAKCVVHATNGHSSHLLPALRGAIFPFRGTMSVHQTPPAFGFHGSQLSWSFSSPPSFDASTGILEAGLYYSNQNPKTGDMFIGGEKVPLDEMLVPDDSIVTEISKQNIQGVLPRFFRGGFANEDEAKSHVRKVWSGIMGWTADHLPLVGRIPGSLTGCGEQSAHLNSDVNGTHQQVVSEAEAGGEGGVGGEFIAAGFNGYGMPQCWSAGEAVARLVLGESEEDVVRLFLPRSYLLSDERFGEERGGMGVEQGLRRLMGA